MNLKEKLKKKILGFRADSESFIDHYRQAGAIIGERVFVFQPFHTNFDDTRPFLIEIGNDVQITRGVTILTHGYDWSVLKGLYGEVLGSSGKVRIGNNVFIGMNATILKGVTIGDNVIVGSGSLVTKDVPSNCVVAGVPAHIICNIDDYYEKRKKLQLSEAKDLYQSFVKSYGHDPSEEDFAEFFWLFYSRDSVLPKAFEVKMRLVGNYEYSMQRFKETKPLYNGFQEFLRELKK